MARNEDIIEVEEISTDDSKCLININAQNKRRGNQFGEGTSASGNGNNGASQASETLNEDNDEPPENAHICRRFTNFLHYNIEEIIFLLITLVVLAGQVGRGLHDYPIGEQPASIRTARTCGYSIDIIASF